MSTPQLCVGKGNGDTRSRGAGNAATFLGSVDGQKSCKPRTTRTWVLRQLQQVFVFISSLEEQKCSSSDEERQGCGLQQMVLPSKNIAGMT